MMTRCLLNVFPRTEYPLSVTINYMSCSGPVLLDFQPISCSQLVALLELNISGGVLKGEMHFSVFNNKKADLLVFFLINNEHNCKQTNLSPWEMTSGKWELVHGDLWGLQKQSAD